MRILIVEDELLVRMFAVDALEDAGFAVEQAGSAAEALRSFSQLGEVLEAVIIDLGLPDRSGDELAAELRALRADIPILIASGRSEREIRDRFEDDKHLGVLVKPYTASMLVEALESVGVKSPNPGM
jgi:DNA-binding response OmpR family regulator